MLIPGKNPKVGQELTRDTVAGRQDGDYWTVQMGQQRFQEKNRLLARQKVPREEKCAAFVK